MPQACNKTTYVRHIDVGQTKTRGRKGLNSASVLKSGVNPYIGHEVHAALALLFLELEGDAADGATLDALHQVLRD